MVDAELAINAVVSPELLPSPYAAAKGGNNGEISAEEGSSKEGSRQTSMCKISIEFTSYTTLKDVQVFLEAPEPLAITNSILKLSNLCKDIYVWILCA